MQEIFCGVLPDQYVHSLIHFIAYSGFRICMVNIFSVSGSNVYGRQLCVQILKIQWIISSSKLVPFLMFAFNHAGANLRNLCSFSVPAFVFARLFSTESLKTISSLPYSRLHERPHGCGQGFPPSLQASLLVSEMVSTSATVAHL